ncbi:MAG: FKBP-type peptidyl-prolyl cis-trans isomerase [Bacteroidia bacterium]
MKSFQSINTALCVLLFVTSACSSKQSAPVGNDINSSMSYEVLNSFYKEPGSLGDIIEYDFRLVHNGKILTSTYEIPDYRERAMLRDANFDTDYMHVLNQLSIDDSVMIKTNIESIPNEHLPPNLNSTQGTLELIVSVRNIWNENNVIDEMVGQLSNNKPDEWIKTGRGVRVFWDAKGNGPKAEYGDSIRIHVKGLFPSGAVFMNTMDAEAKQPISFLLGEGLIQPLAWDDACSLTSQGDKITILSPHDMAFGNKDIKPILKYSILVFEIDVLEVIKD